MVSLDAIRELVNDDVVIHGLPDAQILKDYLDHDCPHGDPIFLSLGESWSHTPQQLVHYLQEAGPHTHGYQLSMHGLPALRRLARSRIVEEHRLGDVARPGVEFEVGITWSGTRSSMFDFARYLADQLPRDGRTPVVIAAGPSWNYEGVFAPLGYQVRYFPLHAKDSFRPDPQEFTKVASDIEADPDKRLACVIINAQHNPTGQNWPAEFVRTVIRHAVAAEAGVLIDDAFFAVVDDDVTPTSAIRILLSELDRASETSRQRWVAVRSFGKEFRCNGWGIGAVTAQPRVLDQLVYQYRFAHSFPDEGVHQYAMARWLSDTSATANFLTAQRHDYTDKRAYVTQFLREHLGHSDEQLQHAQCGPYLLMAIPAAYAELENGVERFRMDCFATTGVLFADAWSAEPADPAATHVPYLRVYLGPEKEILRTAMVRLEKAGFHYVTATPPPAYPRQRDGAAEPVKSAR